MFFRGFRKIAVLKTKADASATENPVAQARPLALNRASPMPSLTWQVAVFAPPNNAMHADLLQRAASMKGELTALRKPVMAAVGLFV